MIVLSHEYQEKAADLNPASFLRDEPPRKCAELSVKLIGKDENSCCVFWTTRFYFGNLWGTVGWVSSVFERGNFG